MLARELLTTKVRNNISHLKHENGTVARSSPEIVGLFQTFYVKLYNLVPTDSDAISTQYFVVKDLNKLIMTVFTSSKI